MVSFFFSLLLRCRRSSRGKHRGAVLDGKFVVFLEGQGLYWRAGQGNTVHFQNWFYLGKGSAFPRLGNKHKTNATHTHFSLRRTSGCRARNKPVSEEQEKAFFGRILCCIRHWGREGNSFQTEGRKGRTCLFWPFLSFPFLVWTPIDSLTWWWCALAPKAKKEVGGRGSLSSLALGTYIPYLGWCHKRMSRWVCSLAGAFS